MDNLIEELQKTCISGPYLTKDVRHEHFGEVTGSGSMKPERYQRTIVERITERECNKTNTRLNWRTLDMVEQKTISDEDGYDYTENFDGVQRIGNKTVFYNFKCIVGKGGSQTRSLKDVYRFIETQLQWLQKNPTRVDTFFINILDGDEPDRVRNRFLYLLNLYEPNKAHVFIGELKEFIPFYKTHIVPRGPILVIKEPIELEAKETTCEIRDI